MTTIDRLGLIGIRSYGTDEETFIKFYKPLTIILGRNGSGKSTIIEAVKMATTGDLPPMVDKGAAFIHDPRIDNETETKAKIRLMFTNVRGDQYVVARHFQLSLRRGPRGVGYKTEFKTLDQTLRRMDRDGAGATSSYRCNDLNALLPDVMRVTKPVLNNVIFVHQEDSLWPLGDSKKLKEKFDEIFAATRYTKALDTIRKYRRDQAADLRTVAVELMHFEDKVQTLEKIRAEVDEIREKYEGLSKGVDALESELTALRSEREAAETLAGEYEEKLSELEKLLIEVKVLEKDKATKYSEMELHLPDMDEQALRAEIEELQTFLDRADGERAKRGKLIEDLTTDVDMRRSEYEMRQNRKGMLEQQEKMQEERLTRLQDLKGEFRNSKFFEKASQAEGRDACAPSLSASTESWTIALESLLKDIDDHVQRVAMEGNKSQDRAAAAASNVKLRLQSARASVERNASEMNEKRTKAAAIREELRNLDDSQASIVDAEAKLKAVEGLWKERCASSRTSDLVDSITMKRKELSTLREDLSVLRRTREDLVQDQNEQARFDVCREAVAKKKKQVHATLEDFTDILVSSIAEVENGEEDTGVSNVKSELAALGSVTDTNADVYRRKLLDAANRTLARRDTIVQQAERSRNECNSRLSTAESRKLEVRGEFDSVKRELEAAERELFRASESIPSSPQGISEVEEVAKMLSETNVVTSEGGTGLRHDQVDLVGGAVDKLDTAVVKSNQRISQLETGGLLAEGDLAQFEEDPKHKCPACGLSSSKRVEEMRANLQGRVDYFKDPTSIQTVQKELRELERTSRTFKKMHVLGSKASNLLRTYEATSEKLQEVDAAVRESQQEAVRAEAVMVALRERVGSSSCTDQISAKQLEMKQSFADLDRGEKELSLLQASISVGGDGARSLSEVDGETRSVEEKLQRIQDDVDKESRALEREREDLRRSETRFHAAKQQCLELQTMAEKHKRLAAEKNDLTSDVRALETSTETLRNESKALATDLEYADTEFATVRAETSHSLNDANAQFSKMKMAVQSWKNCLREVEAFKRSGKDKELQNLMKSLETINADIVSKVADLKAHEKEQQTASDSQKDMESKIRNLRDNQRFRLLEQELNVHARSIRYLRDQIAALERRAGGKPPAQVQELSDRINEINARWHATHGKKQVYTDRYKEKQRELSGAEKQGSRRKYDECRIRKQTMELASSDLERYHRALDQALMAFHTLKMNSINQTIKELWQQTYRGTDIDEIEITSDHGDPRSAATGALKRTFNYRVQMRQGQATLDMRGRCSAGQKVLACLVIRLALAESFCTDCGILALDEPTTNLDRENIGSLADALKTIIETRRRHRNFQLILITHDEEFIDMIGARDFANEYFVVYKDKNEVSRAKVQDLQEML